MKVCRILPCFILFLLFSYAGYVAGKALIDEDCKSNLEQIHTLSKREAVVNEEQYAYPVKSHQKYKRRRSPFGIVYQDGKPIGILEPISRIYEYQNFQDDLNSKVIKRDNLEGPTGEDSFVQQDGPKGDSENSLRSFRMNPHFHEQTVLDVTAENSDKQDLKRDAQKKTSNENRDNSKLSAIENNLKEIISDLNTISSDEEDNESDSDNIDKRDAQMEDEDLDNGVNKIGLTKETHPKGFEIKTVGSSFKEKKSADNQALEGPGSNKKKVADYRSEGETFIRQKRQQDNAAKQEVSANDIVKGLEASGDLTVSGNKSPLASASSTIESEGKKGKGEDFEKRDKQTDDLEYEKRLQRNIQHKITEIKEQVKREIQALDVGKKSTEAPIIKPDETKKLDKKDVSANEKEKRETRRKRQNLLDQDTSGIDIEENVEPNLANHIRQKRALNVEDNDNAVDYAGNDEEFDNLATVSKRDAPSSGFGITNETPNQDVALAKEPTIASSATVKDTKRTAPVVGGLDAEKLEKMVKESASLTESIKSERGARYGENGPHVEVELHGPAPTTTKLNSFNKDEIDEEIANQDAVALSENHADASNIVVNSGNKVVMKRSAEKKNKAFREREDPKQIKTTIEEIEAVSDSSPAPAHGDDEHKYKAYEASTKLIPRAEVITPSDLGFADAKIVETRTDSPESSIQEEKDTDLQRGEKIAADKQTDLALEGTQRGIESEDGDLTKRAILKQNLQTPKQSVRQERKSGSMFDGMSLEDMQALDSENNMKRRRRYIDEYDDYNPRDKRDYDIQQDSLPAHYKQYRGDEDEADDESDEFDDDNFDDRTANLMRKRAAQEMEDYVENSEMDDDYESIAASRMNKRNANARDYVARMNEDAYDSTNYLYDANGRPLNRNKRQVLNVVDSAASVGNKNMAALHGGGPMVRHLAAIRGRNIRMEPGVMKRKLDKSFKDVGIPANSVKGQMISGLSENDIFGALPQSYEGELTRFKRVKRDDPAG